MLSLNAASIAEEQFSIIDRRDSYTQNDAMHIFVGIKWKMADERRRKKQNQNNLRNEKKKCFSYIVKKSRIRETAYIDTFTIFFKNTFCMTLNFYSRL